MQSVNTSSIDIVLSATGEALSRELRMAVHLSGVIWVREISTPPAKK